LKAGNRKTKKENLKMSNLKRLNKEEMIQFMVEMFGQNWESKLSLHSLYCEDGFYFIRKKYSDSETFFPVRQGEENFDYSGFKMNSDEVIEDTMTSTEIPERKEVKEYPFFRESDVD
jgi:hypothetical protein